MDVLTPDFFAARFAVDFFADDDFIKVFLADVFLAEVFFAVFRAAGFAERFAVAERFALEAMAMVSSVRSDAVRGYV